MGGLAEDHAPDSSMGPTFQAIIANQFERTRDGDRMWYQNIFSGSDLRAIQQTTLADIIARNTTTTNLQSNVFVFETSISGRVTTQQARNPRLGFNGFYFRTPWDHVQLLDTSGNVIATTQTGRNGNYTFNDPGLGTYSVQVVTKPGVQVVGTGLSLIQITRSQDVTQINFKLIGILQSLLSGFGAGLGDSSPLTAGLSSPDPSQG